MDRREFLARAGLVAAWAAIPIAIEGCGDDYDKNPTGGGGGNDDDVAGVIGSNHGHAVTVTRVQINAGQDVTLTLSGSHTHTVNLTAAELATIGDGGRVAKSSSSDSGHSHTVTFN